MEDVKRPYAAPRREQAARATRLAVLAAARDLFVEQGWAATTVEQVARRAGVSRPTVFAVGSKADLLRLARDLAMAGDDGALSVAQRESFLRVTAEPDLGRRLDLLSVHVADVQARYARLDAVLHQAAGADAELRALWETSEQQRRTGAALALTGVEDALLPGLQRSVDLVWSLMASEPYRRLVLDSGWGHEAYVQWLARALRAAVM